MEFKSPFPYFGGKRLVAAEVWRRLGNPSHYIEPFFGSGAVLFARPGWQSGNGWLETVNDKDGMVSNFFRAIQADPDTVAEWADWPALENDLTARHAWLVNQKFNTDFVARLEGDPDFYDPKIAGWWCWGLALWIGSGFCSGNGSWVSVDGKLIKRDDDNGGGVSRKRPFLFKRGRGVQRQLVHLGSAGRGVHRQRVHLGDAGRGIMRQTVARAQGQGQDGDGTNGLYPWFRALSARLARVRVCSGDWSRIVTPSVLYARNDTNPIGVFLDPPYGGDVGRDNALYAEEDLDIAREVAAWAIANGDNPRLRIALCGYIGEHDMPDTWSVYRWSAGGGMASKNSPGMENRHKETIWFSPHCLGATDRLQLSFLGAGG